MEKRVAIIPARRGSKGVKNKNLTQLNGKGLIELAIQRALDSELFSKIIITSDYYKHEMKLSPEIKSTAFTQLFFLLRPTELATDDALMIDVIKHALKDVGGDERWVWLLQPTSPFRSYDDFQIINKAMVSGAYEGAISFRPAKEPPEQMCTWKNGVAHKTAHGNFKNRDDMYKYVIRSGNFYVTKRSLIDSNKKSEDFTWYNKPYFSYCMGNIDFDTATKEQLLRSRMLGSNIDDPDDLDLVKNYIRRGDVSI